MWHKWFKKSNCIKNNILKQNTQFKYRFFNNSWHHRHANGCKQLSHSGKNTCIRADNIPSRYMISIYVCSNHMREPPTLNSTGHLRKFWNIYLFGKLRNHKWCLVNFWIVVFHFHLLDLSLCVNSSGFIEFDILQTYPWYTYSFKICSLSYTKGLFKMWKLQLYYW